MTSHEKSTSSAVSIPHEGDSSSGLSRTATDNAWIKFMTRLRWYPADMPPEEKSLVLKLDLMILIYGCLCFFTKYLSQASLTNAFVTYALYH